MSRDAQSGAVGGQITLLGAIAAVCRHPNETVALATVELTELLIRGSGLAVVVVVSSTLGVG
jgi:hypothetical protein